MRGAPEGVNLKMRSTVFLIVEIVLLLGGALFPLPEVHGFRLPAYVAAPQQDQAAILELAQTAEREVKGGETHEFTVSLQAGQFLHIDVEQIGIDVEVALLAPDKQKLLTIDSPNDQYGPELVVWEAKMGGEYALLALLLLIASTGLLLLSLRHTGAMGPLLALHFGLVLSLFVALPYSKMVHGLYRGLALLRNAQDRRARA